MTDSENTFDIPPSAPDPAPLLPENKEEKKEKVPEAESKPIRDELRFPDPVQHTQYNAEPEDTSYRWVILISYALAAAIAGSISTYYNTMEILLVDVGPYHITFDRCTNNPFQQLTGFI